MSKAEDPYYNRKPVPKSFVQDVGLSGLSREEEFLNRERKFSATGADIRKWGHKKDGGWKPESDPYYGRKRVSDAEIADVGATGLSAEEEYLNRERKYSVNGVDVRKFGSTSSGGWHPADDPYYSRKNVKKSLTNGVGETGLTPAEEYEVRERKQSMVQLSSDPFAQFSGAGHRQSISAIGGEVGAAASRRRSSAMAPNVKPGSGPHSGYGSNDTKLQPIASRPEPPVFNTTGKSDLGGTGTTAARNDTIDTTGPTGITGHTGHTGHSDLNDGVRHETNNDNVINQHHHEHYDPDSVAPDEVR